MKAKVIWTKIYSNLHPGARFDLIEGICYKDNKLTYVVWLPPVRPEFLTRITLEEFK